MGWGCMGDADTDNAVMVMTRRGEGRGDASTGLRKQAGRAWVGYHLLTYLPIYLRCILACLYVCNSTNPYVSKYNNHNPLLPIPSHPLCAVNVGQPNPPQTTRQPKQGTPKLRPRHLIPYNTIRTVDPLPTSLHLIRLLQRSAELLLYNRGVILKLGFKIFFRSGEKVVQEMEGAI
jgi:hypothetical protein